MLVAGARNCLYLLLFAELSASPSLAAKDLNLRGAEAPGVTRER